MTDVWLVARREIAVRGRTKGFLIGLAVTALLVVALAVLPRLLGGGDSYTVGFVGSEGLRPAVAAAATAQQAEVTVRQFPDEASARAAVVDGDLDAAVIDDATLLADGPADQELRAIVQAAHQNVRARERLSAAGLDPAQVTEAMRVPPLAERSVRTMEGDPGTRTGIAVLIVIVLFFLLISSVTSVAMGVVEEKGSRIVELLLTSIRPWQLLAGKIIGLGVLGLVNLVVVIVAGLAATLAAGPAVALPPDIAGIAVGAVVWFLLGYAFFSAMAAAFGALVSRQEDVNSVLTPMTMLLMATYFVAFFAVSAPTGTLARVLSLVPPFSSMVMPVRMVADEVQVWELALAGGLMLLAVAGVTLLGARVYARAVLRTGARVKLGEVMR